MLLLDEVLAGLTPAEREPMITLLGELRAEGMTLVLVEHVMPSGDAAGRPGAGA
ncbi:hypothetical protein ACFSTC_01270 [Nonomuraea ferruginea]